MSAPDARLEERLQRLLREPGVTDICVNGPGPLWVDRGTGLVRDDLRVDADDVLRALAVRWAMAAGQRLDDAMPYADVRLEGGARLHAVLPPLSPSGVHLSLRVPGRRTLSVEDLVACGSLPEEGAAVLVRLVTGGAPFLVTGGTGTGKTTVLSALLSHVPAWQRLVLVEELAELRPQHPHVVRLQTRAANGEGAGGVGLDVLIRQSLRMRPDRLVVGEARGREVVDMLAAFNTGHVGGCGTLHADRPEAVVARVEALAAMAGLPAAAAHSQLAAGVRAVVHLHRRPDGERMVQGLSVLEVHGSRVVVVPAVVFEPGRVRRLPAADRLDPRDRTP